MSDATPTLLLVHGAWHGAWCWATLQSHLDARGVASHAVDLPGHGTSTLPLGDLYSDAQHVADVARAIGGDVTLVGHSYGGAVISEAAHLLADESTVAVTRLVYVAAFCLSKGESIADFNGRQQTEHDMLSAAVRDLGDGTLALDPDGAVAALYQCTHPAMARAAVARLSPQPIMTVLQPMRGEPWRTVPSTYVLCEQDNGIPASQQREMAQRCRELVVLDTDHSPFVSAPAPLADVLTSA